jgi:hypothetical protein
MILLLVLDEGRWSLNEIFLELALLEEGSPLLVLQFLLGLLDVLLSKIRLADDLAQVVLLLVELVLELSVDGVEEVPFTTQLVDLLFQPLVLCLIVVLLLPYAIEFHLQTLVLTGQANRILVPLPGLTSLLGSLSDQILLQLHDLRIQLRQFEIFLLDLLGEVLDLLLQLSHLGPLQLGTIGAVPELL